MVGVSRQGFAEDGDRVCHNRRREDGGKEGMKGAAVVDGAPIAVMMTDLAITMIIPVMVMAMGAGRARGQLSIDSRRRYDASELRQQKRDRERARQTAYRPKPRHQRPGPTP